MGDDLSQDERKAIIKEALTEWLDQKYMEFGKWSFKSFAALCFVATLYWLVLHGYVKT